MAVGDVGSGAMPDESDDVAWPPETDDVVWPPETDDVVWPPVLFAAGLQEAGEAVADGQLRLLRSLLAAGGGAGADRNGLAGLDGLTGLGALGREAAVFKTRVQSGGRISVPDAEREALDIDEGDIVQAVVVPIPSGETDP